MFSFVFWDSLDLVALLASCLRFASGLRLDRTHRLLGAWLIYDTLT